VNSELVTETGASAGGHEGDEPPVGQPHDAAAGHGEHKIIGAFAIDSRRQLGGDKPRERDGPVIMAFLTPAGSPQRDHAAPSSSPSGPAIGQLARRRARCRRRPAWLAGGAGQGG
jgi:hypothetical protein